MNEVAENLTHLPTYHIYLTIHGRIILERQYDSFLLKYIDDEFVLPFAIGQQVDGSLVVRG